MELAGVGTSPYAAQRKVYPREVSGLFARLRKAAMLILLGLFYGLPWVSWNHRQAILFDLPARKFFLFGLTLFPQDFYLLTWLLVIAALSLFFFTAIAGRLWCGYACPQTVWTDAFLWMERLTEGSRSQQMKLDCAPWGARKVLRKGIKQLLWVSFAAWTGFTFVGFFSPIEALGRELLLAHHLGGWELFWIIFYGGATYGNAGFLREQVCKYMCPYARFQSAMFDRHSLIISYDEKRGEPRGSRPRGGPVANQGDCIDCTLCVQVCPTGIDIREGLQYECIACAACIDACDVVMDKVGSPRGLIRYSTQAELDGAKTRLLRPRVAVYGSILGLLLAGFAYAVTHRSAFDLDVIRDRNTLYRELDDGRIENVFTVRIINKDQRPHQFRFRALGLKSCVIDGDAPSFFVGPEEVNTQVVRVRVPAGAQHGGQDFKIEAEALDDSGLRVASRARFFSP